MKTYSKKLLVAFFFSMLPMVLMSCSMDPEKASFSISCVFTPLGTTRNTAVRPVPVFAFAVIVTVPFPLPLAGEMVTQD